MDLKITYPKGCEWRKWDLHVLTPYSLVQHFHGQTEEERWENFISALEALPEQFKVIGINDYLFIDGYKKVLEYRNPEDCQISRQFYLLLSLGLRNLPDIRILNG